MAKIKYAATIILSRGPDHDPEVYLARRAPEIRFFGDYWVFPGGNVSNEDYADDDTDLDSAFRRCVVREVDEEINISVRPQDLQAVFRITTPPFAPVLFDTQFMHARAQDDEYPQVDGYELVEGDFVKPAEVLNAWRLGEIKIAPPVLYLLEMLAESGLSGFYERAREASDRLEQGHLHPVYFSPGIFMAPLATDTIPPATTTNTLIVGSDRLYIIDPASPDANEQKRLFDKLDAWLAEGKQLESILLTHHHIDHVGAVNAVSQRYAVPVRAHDLCYPFIADGYLRGESLVDGDILELGTAPDGSRNWHLKVMHTPGHAIDHLCFLESRYRAAIVGDMLSTVSTILINPPEGHMRTYLNSLKRLLATPIRTLYPAHGPAHRDGAEVIRYFIQHRQERELATIKSLTRTPQSIDEILPKIYDDVPESVYPIAARSLLASLIKLEEDGVCQQETNGWRHRQRT